MSVSAYAVGDRPTDMSVVRGPYLQSGTPDSAVLRWRTSSAVETVAWLGPSAGNLVEVFSDAVAKIEHEVDLTGLDADTEYFYAVGDENGMLAGDDADHRFRTPPAFGTATPTRIWVIGDSGFANAGARAVRDSYAAYNAGGETDVWLLLGDNAYANGTDGEYQAALFDTYPGMLRNTFAWPALGNHDTPSIDVGAETGPYFDMFTLPRQGEAGGWASQTEAYYSFDYGDIHFISLDSDESDRSPGGAMMTWLQADLANTTAEWIIAYWHHPPYTKGSHDSDNDFDSSGRMNDMRENALPILEAGGVDLVLTAHSHSYERSFLLDGHYGKSGTLTPAMKIDQGDGSETGDGSYAKPGSGGHEGAVYAVVGGSASPGGGSFDHPVMMSANNELGSMVIDIDGDRLDARFLDDTGTVLDEFTLFNGVERSLTRDQPQITLADGGTQNFFLNAGVEHAGKNYIVAGSFGTSPGLMVGDVHVPLNDDVWLSLSLQAQNSSVYPNTLGVLDENGRAQAAMVVPSLTDPNLIGRAFYHAFGVFEPSAFLMASNAVKLTLK